MIRETCKVRACSGTVQDGRCCPVLRVASLTHLLGVLGMVIVVVIILQNERSSQRLTQQGVVEELDQY